MKRHSGAGLRAGFTLIELLVVISIMGLLMAILLPSLSKARERSKRTVCATHLRALSLAMHDYAYDGNDRLPNLNPPGITNNFAGATAALIALYQTEIHEPKIFHCPSDSDPVPADITTADYLAANSARTSYDFYSIYWKPENGPRLTRVDRAPLAWDLNGGSTTPINMQNHGNTGGNVSFGDGHAEWQPAGEWDKVNWPYPGTQYYQ